MILSHALYSEPLLEALIYHDPRRSGFFSLGWSTASGRATAALAVGELKGRVMPPVDSPLFRAMQSGKDWRNSIQTYAGKGYAQKSFPLAQLESVLSNLKAHIPLAKGDSMETTSVWISQGEFRRPNRQKQFLARISVCWVDLDLRHFGSPEHLQRLSPKQALAKVLARCRERKLPNPSIVLWTGRGLAVKWGTDTLPRSAYPRWAAVQKALVEAFADLGADDSARDASRVLRVAGTYNPKGDKDGRCVAIHVNLYFGQVVRVSFDDLADAVLPLTRRELQALTEQRASQKRSQAKRKQQFKVIPNQSGTPSSLKKFNGVRLAQAQLADYRKLAKLRPVGARPEGWTNSLVWLAASALAIATWADEARWERELPALLHVLAPHWSPSRGAQAVASIRSRMATMRQGEWVDHGGRKVPPVYTPRHALVIGNLGLTDEEMRQLEVLISPALKRERARERKVQQRAANGAVSRQQYLQDAAARQMQARALHAAGKTWREVGEALGVGRDAARMLAARAGQGELCTDKNLVILHPGEKSDETPWDTQAGAA